MPNRIEMAAFRAYALGEQFGGESEYRQDDSGTDDARGDSQGASISRLDLDGHGEERFPEARGESLLNLPPADGTSAGTPDDIGPTQPETEPRRSVATGRDAPVAPAVSGDGEIDAADGGHWRDQRRVVERRIEGQKSATVEHLTRIHTIVERLLEVTEAHLAEGDQKLQSLEHRVAQVEMRYSLNRTSP
jgi:hypothetical protein